MSKTCSVYNKDIECNENASCVWDKSKNKCTLKEINPVECNGITNKDECLKNKLPKYQTNDFKEDIFFYKCGGLDGLGDPDCFCIWDETSEICKEPDD